MQEHEQEQIQYIPIDRIRPDPAQPRKRFSEESLRGLTQSMQEVGQLQPIRVRKVGDWFEVLDGERRTRAGKNLGWSCLACIIESRDLNEAQILHRQLIANLQKDDLNPMEKARGLAELMQGTGWNGAEVAKHLGMWAGTVSKLLTLLALPREIQEQIERGKLKASAAYELSKADGAAQQELAASGMSRDAIRGRLRRKPECNGKKVARVNCAVPGGVVTVAGAEITIDGLIQLLEDVLGKARKARTQGMEAGTFAKMLRDQLKGGQS